MGFHCNEGRGNEKCNATLNNLVWITDVSHGHQQCNSSSFGGKY